ncbi:MAG TPA: hypothetical protein VHZ97_30115 [Pseudonocardiaceae bacterium]|jgi:hypothetical protein|nr:hypothetical protein [Pseudonocardiaceae bacterium]
MDAARAISSVVEWIRAKDVAYPSDLSAAQFVGGWCVYSPQMIADTDPPPDRYGELTRSVFLVGDSGRVDQIESSDSPEDARDWFQEACLYFSSEENADIEALYASGLPSHPDLTALSRSGEPRAITDYDRMAMEALAKALTEERDFSGWLANRLAELADLLGGRSPLVTRRHRSTASKHVLAMAEPEDGPRGAWRETWPAVDPAGLPDVDPGGWLLVPGEVAYDYLEDLTPESDAAGRIAAAIAETAPPWRACQVTELIPRFVAVRRSASLDADIDELRRHLVQYQAGDALDRVLVRPSPGDADVDALLRIAIDADQQQREVIDIDAATTAAYRRLLDRLGLSFENYVNELFLD